MKKLLLLVIVFSPLFFACSIAQPPAPLPQGQFWAQNFVNDTFYQLEAELLAENSLCEVWVEKGSGVRVSAAQAIANEYSDNIYPKMMDAFGVQIQSEQEILNTMQFADNELGDGNGKFCILLLDIKDGYKMGVNDTFVAGYFWDGNFFDNNSADYRSNERDMIYMDIKPSAAASPIFFTTLSHEMQHLMNYVTSAALDRDPMDIWIDEGLSSAAEWIYKGNYHEDYVERFNDDVFSGLIKKGNNFFVWGNRENENIDAALDDYTTVYFFFQWLRIQSSKEGIYGDIISSEHYDYNAVVNAFDSSSSWGSMLRDWLAANSINDSSGIYGYKNESILKNIKAPYAPAGSTSIDLYPGEGVYSLADSSTMPADTGNIKYAGLKTAVSSTISADDTLLTYNVNTNIEGSGETGIITGIAASSNVIKDGSRSARGYGPFPISAGDMLRRKGYSNFPYKK